jgi:hypothetical protein
MQVYNLKKGGQVTYIPNYVNDIGVSLLWNELKTVEIFKQPILFEKKNGEFEEVEATFAKVNVVYFINKY